MRSPLVVLALGLAACASPSTEKRPMPIPPGLVVAFLDEFEALAAKENFELIEGMIDEHAYFRFNDGDFFGRSAIRAVFEKTWRGDPTVKKVRFYLTDVVVLTTDERSATATYTYHWEGTQADRQFAVKGRGTRVVVLESGRLRIIHEHLSRFPISQ